MMLKPENSLEGIKKFNTEEANDCSFNLFNDLSLGEYDEAIERLGNKFSNMYYIACSPFAIENWKDHLEIYNLLKSYAHTAEGRTFEVLIGEYNQETMNEMAKKNEELKKQYEGIGIEVAESKKYLFIVGFYGGTSGRTIQVIISELKKQFPGKIKTITPDNLK